MLEPAPTLAMLIEENLRDILDSVIALIIKDVPPPHEEVRSFLRTQASTYVTLGLQALRTGNLSSFLAFRQEASQHLGTTSGLGLEQSIPIEAHLRAAVWDSILPKVRSDHQQLTAFAHDMKTLDTILDAAVFTGAETHPRVKEELVDSLNTDTPQKQQGLSVLEEVETLLVSASELQPTLDLVTQRMGEISKSRAVFLLLKDESRQRYKISSIYAADSAMLRSFSLVDSHFTELTGNLGSLQGPAYVPEVSDLRVVPSPIRTLLSRYGIVSALAIPLLVEDQAIGLVALCSGKGRHFVEEEIHHYTLLANRAAIAINDSRLYESARRKAEELTSKSQELERLANEKDQVYGELQEKLSNLVALQKVSQAVVSSLDLHDVLQTITSQATQVLGASKAAVVALNPETGALECIAMTGFPSEYADRVKAGCFRVESTTLVGAAISQGRPQWTDDALIDSRFPDTGELARLGRYRSMLAVPIGRENPPATLCVYADEPDAFPESRIEILSLFANHAAIAIRNAQLYAQQVHSEQHAAFLAEVSDLFNSSLELATVLQIVAEKVTEVLGDGCVIYELPEGNDLLEANIVYRRDPAKTEVLRRVLEATPPRLGVGVSGRVAQSGQAMLIVDARHRNVPDPDRPHLDKLNLISVIGVPLKVKNRILGALVTSVTDSERHFDEDDLTLAIAIAERAAIAIENARLYQSERKRVNALKEVNQLKSDFVSSVSHELRTPLTTIKGSLQTLLRSWERMEVDKRQHYVQMAHDASDRLLRLIEDILFVSRVEAVRPRSQVASIDPCPVVERAVRDVRMQYSTKAVEAILPAQPPLVLAEESKLLRVLANLLDNAVKYSGAEKAVQVGLQVESDQVTISVADNGIGIAAQDQSRLFTRFGRVGRAARTQPGTGLGLFITKQLVEEMGGRIWLESQPGRGSTFYFSLPISSEETFQQSL